MATNIARREFIATLSGVASRWGIAQKSQNGFYLTLYIPASNIIRRAWGMAASGGRVRFRVVFYIYVSESINLTY
jgi:hypothetical protein